MRCMIGSVRHYLDWLNTPDNGYLGEAEKTMWENLACEPRNEALLNQIRKAVRAHYPNRQSIPATYYEDPELDLGGYLLGLSDAKTSVWPDDNPYRASLELPEDMDLEVWFGRQFATVFSHGSEDGEEFDSDDDEMEFDTDEMEIESNDDDDDTDEEDSSSESVGVMDRWISAVLGKKGIHLK
jgi:hypothetical protein